MKINDGLLAQLREATQLLQTAGPMAATEAIQRALQGSTSPKAASPKSAAPHAESATLRDINPPPTAYADAAAQGLDILARMRVPSHARWNGMPVQQPIQDVDADVGGKGRFVSGSCTNHAGTRAYKLYIPSAYSEQEGKALPLVVMLHGCKQHPDDFAAGTAMNVIAEEHNCFVVYPAQMQAANGSNCWNWFKPEDQRRDRGEPSIIADITRDIIRTYNIDASRVYVAGLSAGGAMAAVMGATYPELFTAVGVHSGLPYGVAHDVPSAFATMSNAKMKTALPGAGTKAPAPLGHTVPIIVFHGDRDTTVHPANGDKVLAQCVPQSHATPAGGKSRNIERITEKGSVPNGRAYTRTIHRDDQGKALAEHWAVHGAGHAWSGGRAAGSYTDPAGPEASREMLRFFFSHAGNAG